MPIISQTLIAVLSLEACCTVAAISIQQVIAGCTILARPENNALVDS